MDVTKADERLYIFRVQLDRVIKVFNCLFTVVCLMEEAAHIHQCRLVALVCLQGPLQILCTIFEFLMLQIQLPQQCQRFKVLAVSFDNFLVVRHSTNLII